MTIPAVPLTSLNAIKLSAREVAATFVAPPAFDALLHADNAILTGPRGSGKTTMLKMMTSEALEHWTGPEADAARATVRSVGVFIGADRTWNEQLAMPGTDLSGDVRDALTASAFTTHGLRAIVESMDYRLRGDLAHGVAAHRRVAEEGIDETALARRISELADLSQFALSFPTLRSLLSDRLVEIGTLRNRLRRDSSTTLPSWCDLDFLVVADAAVEAFNVSAGEPDQKWALLFDELELAPRKLVEELLGALRGSQPRLLFKLSLAPANDQFDVLEHEHAPVPGQDYEHVPLTYARKRPAIKFAKALVEATLDRNSSVPVPPIERFLGSGDLDSREEVDADEITPTRAYDVGSRLWRTMEALRIRDESFADYLTANEIDLENLEVLDPARRAARLRKIRNIVVVREYFRADDGKRRSRKSFGLYTGADSILSLPDGNPRMIISLVRQLFPRVDTPATLGRVPTARQSAAIESTLFRFLALLDAQQAVKVDGKSVALMELVDRVGAGLAAKIVEEPFSDNVALTLRVNNVVRPEIRALFVRGINAGAFVHIPPRHGGDPLAGDIVGRQFRLSHLLATKYGLPIHLTPPSALSELLPIDWRTDAGRARRGRAAEHAATLFDR
ncbi:hypothetical protein [Nocardioides sp. 616]|uniref:ORC-CDC6 family AAA ATPase n=1 Tax=Nocardioides sp. 616 TaxID=2268090 RepID=UPI0013B42778|nr:hypothetical protein [Nocardioides sp. 616]